MERGWLIKAGSREKCQNAPYRGVYRRQASTRLAVLEEAAEGRTASYQREILHLQRLLRERQEAEERLLQSKREVEEELEVVWQAATRENQQIKETLLDAKITANHHIRAVSGSASPGWPSQDADEDTTSTQHKPPSPELQRRATFKSILDHQNSSLDEKHKYGLDYYC
ncbi:Centrosomal protein of 89 kDa [Collichthys lucidus]|uniref:Centrosomal protein of 89 kDa n=1 Tax=Collichthys lucidus TaxID=240159 RepID=A0A4U5U641_COLLU|nr:Centrosomal protein of 89 kDa [Collichthys lucidus]